jgi:type III restriction enzyme
MELKDFQRTALDTLTAYLDRARISGNPEQAFIQTLRECQPNTNPPPYRRIAKIAGVPNVCLRLPTGGGKTLLAAHTISVAGRAYLERDYPVVLWLVPTSTIRTQTAEALKKPAHPYRAAIDDAFAGRVSVFDISEIDQIRPQDLTERVTVIVATIQSLRTSNPDGRRAYAHSENFEPHFAHIPANTTGLDRDEKGQIKFSFVNLMAFHRPLVIVDEAHKAGTHLSFDMLAALRPSCIVEFTATPNTDPQNGSNVLFRASAAEVKAAQMIKLPIILTEHPDWRAAVHDAIETRARLAETAKSDLRNYIRPLTLFQAQDKGQEVTVDVLKTYLIDNENISPEKIAVATGAQRELDAINLFDPACPVRIHHHRGSAERRVGLFFRIYSVFRCEHQQRHRHRTAFRAHPADAVRQDPHERRLELCLYPCIQSALWRRCARPYGYTGAENGLRAGRSLHFTSTAVAGLR